MAWIDSLGFRVWYSVFVVWGSGFRVWVLGLGVWCLVVKAEGLGRLGVWRLGLRV